MPGYANTVLEVVLGQQIKLPLYVSDGTTGLTLGTIGSVIVVQDGQYVADPATEIGLTLTEVDAIDAPGLYELVATPTGEDHAVIVIAIAATSEHIEFHIRTLAASAELIGHGLLGADGQVTLIATDAGANPLEGVTVRVYTSAGGGLVARGFTDASGEVSFDLPSGSYSVRFSKTGYDFSSYNPTEITVDPYENLTPVISVLLPTALTIGEAGAISGLYFHGDNVKVLVNDEVIDAVVSADKTLLMFTVPDDAGTATIKVRKDDPDNPGGYLTSTGITATIS